MRVLVVDNYDSFVWNLVQALRVLGAETLVHRNDALDVGAALALGADAIVVSPGPCTPAEAGISVDLIRAAARERVPLLGVCLGHQALGVACGGRVAPAARLVHGKTSVVRHRGDALFVRVPQHFQAMRYHSLVVAEPLPHGLVATAWVERAGAPDELMAVRHRECPHAGVQFHPESYLTPEGPRILENFLALARASTTKEIRA